jgi:hypothetical protein
MHKTHAAPVFPDFPPRALVERRLICAEHAAEHVIRRKLGERCIFAPAMTSMRG